MKFIALNILFLLVSCLASGSSQVKTAEDKGSATDSPTAKNPQIELIPPAFEHVRTKDKFVTKILNVKNPGTDTLLIDRVTSNCYCGMATILNGKIAPGDSGRIMLYGNLEGLYGTRNVLWYDIHTNVSGSPQYVTITILPEKKDTLNDK
jgi:hypothetical protein